jgi:hypothetical protein
MDMRYRISQEIFADAGELGYRKENYDTTIRDKSVNLSGASLFS